MSDPRDLNGDGRVDLGERLHAYVPHPHIAARRAKGPVKVADQLPRGGNAVTRFNAALAVRVTKAVGTMACAYAFTLLTLISLPAAIKTGDPIVIVSWIAQTFLQLVLLSVVLLGQNIQAQAADKRAEATFLDAEALLAIQDQMQQDVTHVKALLTDLIDRIARTERTTP